MTPTPTRTHTTTPARWTALAIAALLVAACSGSSEQSEPTVPPTTTATPTTTTTTVATTTPTTSPATTTTVPPTTIPDDGLPPDAPRINLYEPDHIKRTEQYIQLEDWRRQQRRTNLDLQVAVVESSSVPGAPNTQRILEKVRVESVLTGEQVDSVNDCATLVDYTGVSKQAEGDDPDWVWVESLGNYGPCTVTAVDGSASAPLAVGPQSYYLRWERQSDGSWRVGNSIATVDGSRFLAEQLEEP
jgi:hypothetical protein